MNDINRATELRKYGVTALIGLSVVIAASYSDVRLFDLFDPNGISNAGNILSGLLKPNLDADFLTRIAYLSLESLFIGLLGTLIGVVFGVVLALVGARLPNLPDSPGKQNIVVSLAISSIKSFVRFLLTFLRAIPDIVWAYLFVMLLGLGPGPAVIAIALVTCGIVGKLFSELAEATDPQLTYSLASKGIGTPAIWWFCILPQVKRQWVAYALFRMECNIRSGTILGVVGAGGLGGEIALSIRYFEFDKLATALLAILAMVILLEIASSYLRSKPLLLTLGFSAVAGAISLYYIDIPWSDLFTQEIPSFLTNESYSYSASFLHDAFILSGETLLMAWCATIAAAALAFLFAPFATSALTTKSYINSTYPNKGLEYYFSSIYLFLARFILQIFRAMPEITLALIFVVWVGPGPFAGILAIAIHSFGVLGRLYTDVYEEVEHEPAAAIQSAGTSPLGIWIFSILPQVFPRLLSFTLYRFEVNIRATAMVGFVGAGGIGDALHTSISLFQFSDLAMLIFVLLITVVVVDSIGSRLRLRILRPPTEKYHTVKNTTRLQKSLT